MFNPANRIRCALVSLIFLPLLAGCAGNRTILSEHRGPGKIKIVTAVIAKPADKTLVWFVKPDSSDTTKITYEAVTRRYRPAVGTEEQTATMKAVEAAVVELLQGPTAEEEAAGLGSEVPRGTVLISVGPTKDQNGIVLNLSKRFLSGSGAESFGLRLEQLKRTVNEIVSQENPVKAVFLNVEGERLSQATGDGIDVAQPINQ
ncbi:hypothetical protein BH11CYA1_BH11CYA1_26400 [soil metagenome]